MFLLSHTLGAHRFLDNILIAQLPNSYIRIFLGFMKLSQWFLPVSKRGQFSLMDAGIPTTFCEILLRTLFDKQAGSSLWAQPACTDDFTLGLNAFSHATTLEATTCTYSSTFCTSSGSSTCLCVLADTILSHIIDDNKHAKVSPYSRLDEALLFRNRAIL